MTDLSGLGKEEFPEESQREVRPGELLQIVPQRNHAAES